MIFAASVFLSSCAAPNFIFSISSYAIPVLSLLLWVSSKVWYSRNLFLLTYNFGMLLFAYVLFLYWVQMIAHATFLLIAEFVVIIFVLTYFISLNKSNFNSNERNSKLMWVPFVISFLVLSSPVTLPTYLYSILHVSHINVYNDLSAMFLYFYSYNLAITLLVGIWLLILTFLLVELLLASMSSASAKYDTDFSKRVQDLWANIYTKPFLWFFTKK